jgi:hypothetical protein
MKEMGENYVLSEKFICSTDPYFSPFNLDEEDTTILHKVGISPPRFPQLHSVVSKKA